MKIAVQNRETIVRVFITAAAMLIAAAIVWQGLAWAEPVQATQAAPEFSAYTASGKKVSLSDYRGRTVLISFWGAWCATNREEMNYLKDLKDRHPSLVIMAVNSDTAQPKPYSMAGFSAALSEWNVPMEVIFDRNFEIRDRYGVNSLPTGVIVNASGKVAFVANTFFSATPKGFEMMLEDYRVSSLK